MHSRNEPPPNVLLLTCHDIGRHLGCYGVETVQTPNLDALASSGVRFQNAFTVAPSCSPSRAALATGRYPHSNGVMGLAHPPFNWDLAPGEQHVAQLLGSAGFETHLFGLQHVTTSVTRLGFHHLHGFDRTLGCHEHALGHSVVQRVTEFLRQPQSGRPLYIEINLEEPHRPYDQGGALPDDTKGIYVPPYLPAGLAALEEMAALQGAIRQADSAVGQILGLVEEAGLASNMLIIFIADHGLAMPRAKCTLYDPGIEIALVMRWLHGGLPEGTSVSDVISNVDVLPTLLEAVGLPVPRRLQGQSVLPLLRQESYVARAAVYAEKTYHSYYDPMRAIRTARFKYIRNFDSAFQVEVPGDVQLGALFRAHVELYSGGQHPPVELYDLADDPFEQYNLAGAPRLAEIERQLDRRLWDWMRDTDDPLLHGAVPSPVYRQAWEENKRVGSGENGST